MKLLVVLLLNAPVALGALFVAGTAFAQDFDPPEQSEAKAPPFHPFPRRYFEPGSEPADRKIRLGCNDLLRATEKRMGRALTDEEVKRLLPTVLAALENSAAQTSPEPGHTQWQQGLASGTKVLTVDGELDIGLIEPGTQVISYDLSRRLIVSNEVVRIHSGISKSHVTTRLRYKGFSPPPVVSRKQRFYWTDVSTFSPLDTFGEMSHLFAIELHFVDLKIPERNRYYHLPRGELVESPLETPVFQLELKDEPHNFFANQILVQSHIKKAGGK